MPGRLALAEEESLRVQPAEISLQPDLEHILEGLEAELELERELGVRALEFDRKLLQPPAVAELPAAASSVVAAVAATATPVRPSPTVAAARPAAAPSSSPGRLDFVFLHDRPLSSAGIEMMAKIVLAMGKTAETAPIVFEAPVPKAKAYVVLGGLALKKFLPEVKGEPGQWVTTPGGAPALITYSPNYILRFPMVTPAVNRIKRDMWTSLKTVSQRVRQL